MQEEEKKTVDIDTSGPDVEIALPEEKTEEVAEQPTEDTTNETQDLKDGGSADGAPKKSDEQADVQDKNDNAVQASSEKAGDKQQDTDKQIEEYSESVKKRIAKLTKRMREAE